MARRHQVHAAANLAGAVRSAARPGTPSLWRRLRSLPRLVRAVRSGQYTGMSTAQLALLGAGVGYILSPVDVVPEGFLLVLGLVDDAVILSWVAMTLVRETEDFIAWEQGASAAGYGAPPPSASWAPGQQGPAHTSYGETIPSEVVRD